MAWDWPSFLVGLVIGAICAVGLMGLLLAGLADRFDA